MKINILGADGAQNGNFNSISALVDGRVLIDAGTGASGLSLDDVSSLGDAMLTHSHLDHTAMLCFVAESRIGNPSGHGLRVHCHPETADAIREGLLNEKIWPDFESIEIDGVPLMSFVYFKDFEPVLFDGFKATPLPVMHTVPTYGFCLSGEKENFVFISDICDMPKETERYLNELPNFHRMTIEVSFPEGAEKLAEVSGHLTPILLEKLMKRMPDLEEVFYCHVKPRYSDEIDAQMKNRFGDKIKRLQTGMQFDI